MSEAAWMSTSGRDEPIPAVDLRTDRPQSARMYDYYLGGKTNFAADRETAERTLEAFPTGREFARANRAFLRRSVEFLVGQGVRQFLDIGTGIPTSPNTHEIAQEAWPDARIVYTDNDPIVLAHARALLTGGSGRGRIDYLQADLRDPAALLAHPALTGDDPALDLAEPVALQLIAILHFLEDADEPYAVVSRLMDALPRGSWLTVTHFTPDLRPEQIARAAEAYRSAGVACQARTRAEVARFADGLDVVDPGVALLPEWRPRPAAAEVRYDAADVSCYAFVARKR